MTTAYGYNLAAGSPANHALTTITYGDGTHQYYATTQRGGWLPSGGMGTQSELEYTYDALGTVQIKDASGAVSIAAPGAAGTGSGSRGPAEW